MPKLGNGPDAMQGRVYEYQRGALDARQDRGIGSYGADPISRSRVAGSADLRRPERVVNGHLASRPKADTHPSALV
jgi:hypothetical protein